LLSVCIFDILSTTIHSVVVNPNLLWIAFSLYLWYIEHNLQSEIVFQIQVVNCFQFVSLIYWAQLANLGSMSTICCELLSVCIFDILSTTTTIMMNVASALWIAFSLYLWYIEHNYSHSRHSRYSVVNCFQFVSLIYWAQLIKLYPRSTISCELLSVCIFDILSTTLTARYLAFLALWIAFSLYLWYIEHNFAGGWQSWSLVVNCFQFVSLIYWAQLTTADHMLARSCELLSVCIFDILSTTPFSKLINQGTLWIAFSLYLWYIEHNIPAIK
jgi:hypothetical protein